MSGIDKAAPLLTEDNRKTALAQAVHQTKREIEGLIAELAPKPDAPPSIRKLPNRQTKAKPKPGELLGPDQAEPFFGSYSQWSASTGSTVAARRAGM